MLTTASEAGKGCLDTAAADAIQWVAGALTVGFSQAGTGRCAE